MIRVLVRDLRSLLGVVLIRVGARIAGISETVPVPDEDLPEPPETPFGSYSVHSEASQRMVDDGMRRARVRAPEAVTTPLTGSIQDRIARGTLGT